MSKPISKLVAEAIVKSCPHAGRSAPNNTDAERVHNLLAEHKYGPYIVEGDPGDWGNGRALATIYMEKRGGEGDCNVPLSYYEDGFEVSALASTIMGKYFIEFVNAAVACVYEV